MASLIHQYTVSIPADTAKASPYSADLPLPQECVESVDLEVPPGPNGNMGFYLAMSGQQVVPLEVGTFIVWNDRFDSWYLNDYPTTGAWSVVGYNLDTVNAHEVTVRFHDNPISASTTSPTVTISTVTGGTLASPITSPAA